MILYNLRLALLSLKRTPILSGLIVLGIALGIGVAISFVAIWQLFAGDPVPTRSDVLHFVRADAWDPAKPFPGTEESGAPPIALTYLDATALMKSDIPTRKSIVFPTRVFAHPGDGEDPVALQARICHGDFFGMMDVPMEFGSGWDRSADEGGEHVGVIDYDTNVRLFGGRDSVGERLRIEDIEITIVGVVAPFKPFVRYWEMINSPVSKPAEIYLPFELAIRKQWDNSGNDYGWGSGDGEGYEGFLNSESCWLGLWVELSDDEARAAYTAFVDAYALEQKELGRFQRPLNNRVTPVLELLDESGIVPKEISTLTIVSLLFLLLCILNVVGLLMGKFLARAHEIGTRRALGASRWAIFLQHIVECELVGVLGGALGLGAGALLFLWINSMSHGLEFTLMRGEVFGVVILLSLVSGFLAGLYPSWRIATIRPAVYLKQS